MTATSAADDPYAVLAARGRAARSAREGEGAASAATYADERNRAVATLLDAVYVTVFRKARFVAHQTSWLEPVDLAHDVLHVKVVPHAEKVFDGRVAPPQRWPAYVASFVTNRFRDLHRRPWSSPLVPSELAGVRPVEAGPDEDEIAAPDLIPDQTLESVVEDRLVARRPGEFARRVQAALAAAAASRPDDADDPVRCAFHPGRPCVHARAGNRPSRCHHRQVVLSALLDAFVDDRTAEDPPTAEELLKEAMGPRLVGAGKHAYLRLAGQCLDWFRYLLLDGDGDGGTRYTRNVTARLGGVGGKPPAAATVCLIMNNHPRITVPDPLFEKFAADHLERGHA